MMVPRDRMKHVDTMIGEDAVIQGDILLNGGAIIGGKVFGNIMTKGTVRVTKTGYIKGDIKASDAFVGGVVQGNVSTTGKVVLQNNSKVAGDLIYRRLVIEDGAQFAGKCDLIVANRTTKEDDSGEQNEEEDSNSLPTSSK
ncbi:MAG: polymer-forming cytoskeletal protein [Thermodesulfobacteriota bacterium]